MAHSMHIFFVFNNIWEERDFLTGNVVPNFTPELKSLNNFRCEGFEVSPGDLTAFYNNHYSVTLYHFKSVPPWLWLWSVSNRLLISLSTAHVRKENIGGTQRLKLVDISDKKLLLYHIPSIILEVTVLPICWYVNNPRDPKGWKPCPVIWEHMTDRNHTQIV